MVRPLPPHQTAGHVAQLVINQGEHLPLDPRSCPSPALPGMNINSLQTLAASGPLQKK